jgi:hypothetical protein
MKGRHSTRKTKREKQVSTDVTQKEEGTWQAAEEKVLSCNRIHMKKNVSCRGRITVSEVYSIGTSLINLLLIWLFNEF